MCNDNISGRSVIKKWTEWARKEVIATVAGDDRTPPWGWTFSLYFNGPDENSIICLPVKNLMACLREGGTKLKFSGKETFKKVTQSGILIVDDFPLKARGKTISRKEIMDVTNRNSGRTEEDFDIYSEAVLKLGFELNVDRAVVGKSRHIRVRPSFAKWEAEGIVTVTNDSITQEKLLSIFKICGDMIGLCDNRPSSPSKPGTHGKFKVVSIVEV